MNIRQIDKKILFFSLTSVVILLLSVLTGCIDHQKNHEIGKEDDKQIFFQKPLILPNWTDGDYHDYDETTLFIQDLHHEYSDLVEIFSIGKSIQGRDIWCIQITNEQNRSEKNTCVIDGCIHGSEWESAEICLYLAEYLLINFNRNNSVKNILNSSIVYLIPILNPDGRIKDSRYNYNGIDLNRNFDVHFGRFRGGSIRLGDFFGKRQKSYFRFPTLNQLFPNLFPTHVTICGRKPFSEPETNSLKTFLDSLDQEKLSFYVNCHTAVHFVGSAINIHYKPEFVVSDHEKQVLNTALYWFDNNTQYDIMKSDDYLFYGAGYAHHWVFKEYQKPVFLFELLSKKYEPGLADGGPHDNLIYWMKESLPIFLYLLANSKKLCNWDLPNCEPLLPDGIMASHNFI